MIIREERISSATDIERTYRVFRDIPHLVEEYTERYLKVDHDYISYILSTLSVAVNLSLDAT
jgi:hypothetical protein